MTDSCAAGGFIWRVPGWGGGSEEDSGEEGVSCCVELVLPAGLPHSEQLIPTCAVLLDGKHRDGEVC